MIMTLRKKKEALEAMLLEKSSELKKLCIAEAELTGVLPIETPYEANGSPPKFRKRVGTMFPFTEEMLSNLKTTKVWSSFKHMRLLSLFSKNMSRKSILVLL